MPIFEYECVECKHEFEQLVRGENPSSACPECGSGRLRKRMSHLSISTAHTQKRSIQGAAARTESLRYDRAYEDHKIAHKHHD